jgi:probable phosphoglycerate mutase
MIFPKEFYFVRHGQTDRNLLDGMTDEEHPVDMSLNHTGMSQAKAIAPIIASLPIQTVCSSPVKRVQQTKEIIAPKEPPHHVIPDLGECSTKIWNQMYSLGMYSPPPPDGEIRLFMDRVRSGINQALSFPGPILVVAHGGVHWALCCLMGIENRTWALENCGVVHFSTNSTGKWTARSLI